MANGSKILKDKKGFTIIEVVLVLAIAGLIFLIVFLALPQLQRSRRDTQRKNDAGRIASSLESYAGNNNGDYPEDQGEFDDFALQYLNDDEYKDPSTGVTYDWSVAYRLGDSTWAAGANPGDLSYTDGAVCDGEAATTTDAEARNIAVVMKLEQASYCQDNQ